MSSSEKKNTFFGGAAILAASTILIKVIGAVFRIPLGNVLPNAVMGDYNSAYAIYTFFLTVSTAGLPVALSKTISEANALGRRNQVEKTFRVAFFTFLSLGLFSFFCMTVLAVPMSNLVLQNPKALYCVLALSPSVLCVCVMSALRGYFQGHFDMMPTAISQVIESLFKLLVGLALALLIVNVLDKPEFGSVGAIIGVSAGSIIALAYLVFVFLRFRRKKGRVPATDRPDSSKRILSNLMRLAIPITLGSTANSLVLLVDTSLVMRQLQNVFRTVEGLTGQAALDAARDLYGIYSKAVPVYNLPFAMMVPLTACIIPAVSACLTRRDRAGARSISESALRVGMLLALPMGMGLFALGGPIMGLLYPAIDVSIAGPLLSVLGLASIFVAIQLLCNSILQANSMVNLPILAILIGGIVKVVVNYTLVGNPDIRINGAPVGTLCCFIVVSALEIFIIRRTVPNPPRFFRTILKPLLASAVMGAAAWATYGLATSFLHLGNSIATVFAIGVGGVIYLVLVLALKAISKEDLELMPKGEKIAKLLRIS